MPDKFSVTYLSCNSNIELLIEQTIEFKPKLICIIDPTFKNQITERLKPYDIEILYGDSGLSDLSMYNDIDLAINVMHSKDKEDFTYYVNNEVSLNQGNMFISNSSSIINMYFDEVFTWLKKCEKILGFDLKGYGQIRLYAFLAERFLPFWFKKYSKCLDWPIIFNDLRKENFQ